MVNNEAGVTRTPKRPATRGVPRFRAGANNSEVLAASSVHVSSLDSHFEVHFWPTFSYFSRKEHPIISKERINYVGESKSEEVTGEI